MPPGDEVALDRELLEKLFEQLDAELEKKDATARIYVVGGARMTLGLREGRTTRARDARQRPAVYRGPDRPALRVVPRACARGSLLGVCGKLDALKLRTQPVDVRRFPRPNCSRMFPCRERDLVGHIVGWVGTTSRKALSKRHLAT